MVKEAGGEAADNSWLATAASCSLAMPYMLWRGVCRALASCVADSTKFCALIAAPACLPASLLHDGVQMGIHEEETFELERRVRAILAQISKAGGGGAESEQAS
jgi:hypothetical protein